MSDLRITTVDDLDKLLEANTRFRSIQVAFSNATKEQNTSDTTRLMAQYRPGGFTQASVAILVGLLYILAAAAWFGHLGFGWMGYSMRAVMSLIFLAALVRVYVQINARSNLQNLVSDIRDRHQNPHAAQTHQSPKLSLRARS